MPRIGFGFDVHVLEAGRPFYLGGIKLDHTSGAVGHSDADVLIHAVCDAILGALALGDIGLHFPNTDDAYKGIDSKELLRKVCGLMKERGYRVGNIDATICLEKPKVNPHIAAMKNALCPVLGISSGDLSIKATTNEKLGYVGREEGVAAYAVALLLK
ncbi:MAG: 2-C-methyl-D-erythritol 2,4-cyclodiphosphate synthase [Bacteroidia bacterium]|nr:2-C-methyl-D-erythritol 2,4-cyclodiphosphate synthase [Bacteroidia bacterium]